MEIMKAKRNHLTFLFLILLAGILLFSGCQPKEEGYHVTFNTCTNLKTTKIKERTVSAGATITKPNVSVIDEEYSNYVVVGWYLDEEYTKEWNFDTDVVESDIVLYARWEKQFFVRYFMSNEKVARLGEYVPEGDHAEPKDELAQGWKVLGYYADAGYSVPFDFDQPITADTDVYILLSDSIYWNAPAIKNGFIIEASSGEGSAVGEVVLEEKEDESYVRIDFGHSTRTDPHIQAFTPLDMTKSQILTITYRNLGNAKSLRFFWVVEYENGTYSGPGGEAEPFYSFAVDIKRGMSENDEWQTVTVDMGEATVVDGVSQWAQGKTLNIFRIDAEYMEGMDAEFVPNIIEIKEISFAPGTEYISEDTVELYGDDVFAVMDAAGEQEAVSNGYVFPKNREASTPKQGTVQYNKLDCVTYLFPYGSKKGLVSFDMSKLKIDMENNQILCLKYKNEGHGDAMTIRYTTTDGKTGEKEVDIKSKMQAYSTLYINMLNEEDWNGKLDTLSLIYHKAGTNNVLSLQSLYVKPFEAADLPGINFADNKCAGFTDNDVYKILYDGKNESCYVEMLADSAVMQKKVSIDTSIYASLEFTYSVQINGIESITIGYQIGGKWYTGTFDGIKRTSGFETLSIPLEKKGLVTGVKIELNGQGKISMRSLIFKVDSEYALDLSDDSYVKDHFYAEWALNYAVDYDEFKGATLLSGSSSSDSRCMFYLGASGYMENITLDAKNQKVYVCYSNPGETREAELTVYYAGSDNKTGSGIAGNDSSVRETKSVSQTAMLQGNMKNGEWKVAVFDFSGMNLFSADRNATMLAFAPGGDLYLRAIVLR